MSLSPTQSLDMYSEQFADEEHPHYAEDDDQVAFHHEQEVEHLLTPTGMSRSLSSSTNAITRTVAMIKPHAVAHRFEIERRIQEASFEIVKERQMEFDVETDPETLYELFGEDADCFVEGPLWVYVLERRRAVEVWNTLMGDRDITIARRESPNSLRALYGLSTQQNGVMGSSDNQIAEIQISSLFASSPPFPTTELPGEDNTGKFGSIRSVASSVLESMRKHAVAAGRGAGVTSVEDEGYAPSSATNPSTVGGSGSSSKGANSSSTRLNANGKPGFKARPAPSSNAKPDIVPRTTKAAALRANQAAMEKTSGVHIPHVARAPPSKDKLAQTFANVPGHKRRETITVASTAAPTIAPRMTRAASLRLGTTPAKPPPGQRKRSLTDEDNERGRPGHGRTASESVEKMNERMFEGVPGHKRRESFAVASVKAPTVAPRLNKSAALRAEKDKAPPTSFMFRGPSQTKTPTLTRTSSTSSLSPPSQTARPVSSASTPAAPSAPRMHSRASSVVGTRTPTGKTNGNGGLKPNGNGNGTSTSTSNVSPSSSTGNVSAKPKVNGNSHSTPARPVSALRARPSSIAAPPSIAPKMNRSAALRAAKQEAEAAAEAKKKMKAGVGMKRPGPRPSAAPSSFKAVQV